MKRGIRKLLVLCLSMAMLLGSTLNVSAGVAGDFMFTVSYCDVDQNDAVIKTANIIVKGEEKVPTVMDVSGEMPEGYQVDGNYTASTNVEVVPYSDSPNTKQVYVKKIPTPAPTVTTLTVTFETADGTVVGSKTCTNTGDEDYIFELGKDYTLPEGYQLAADRDQTTSISVIAGTTGGHTLVVEPIPASKTVLNLTFETVYGEKVGDTLNLVETAVGGEGEAWTFMLGTDFDLPEGYQLATGVDQVTEIPLVFGTTGGHIMYVEPIPAPEVKTVLNITFETVYGEYVGETTAYTTAVGGEGEAWTFMLGTDFDLPEGYQLATGVDQVTEIPLVFGTTGGHVMYVEPIPAPEVKTELTVTFETADGEKVGEAYAYTTAVGGEGEAWTFMLGTDFDLPEGYQLATGVDQVTNIQVPFGAAGGHTMIVELIDTEDPEDPVDPVDPEDPENPVTPDEPDTDNSNTDNKTTDNNAKTDNVKAEKNNAAPKTGDNANVFVLFLSLAVCAVVILTVVSRKRGMGRR